MVGTDILFLLLALAVLFFSGGVMVRALIWIGRYLRISEYALSFVLAAFATSLPEFFIGVTSAIEGVPAFSLGNLIGSSLLNVTAVLGLVAIFTGSLGEGRVVRMADVRVTIAMIFLPALLMFDGNLSRIDGFILLFFFFGHLAHVLGRKHEMTAVDGDEGAEFTAGSFFRKLLQFIAGSVLLMWSAWIAVNYGTEFATFIGLPIFLAGIFSAIGTTLPEMVFAARSVSLRHDSMSIGNAFGSIIVNTALILGIVSVISPIDIPDTSRALWGLGLTAGVVLLLEVSALFRGRIGRVLGVVLFAVSLAFLAMEAVL